MPLYKAFVDPTALVECAVEAESICRIILQIHLAIVLEETGSYGCFVATNRDVYFPLKLFEDKLYCFKHNTGQT